MTLDHYSLVVQSGTCFIATVIFLIFLDVDTNLSWCRVSQILLKQAWTDLRMIFFLFPLLQRHYPFDFYSSRSIHHNQQVYKMLSHCPTCLSPIFHVWSWVFMLHWVSIPLQRCVTSSFVKRLGHGWSLCYFSGLRFDLQLSRTS